MKTFIVILLVAAEAIATTNVLYQAHKNLTSQQLSREKRFLVFNPNGGILKFVNGYLGPINIPSWQNINCLRNMQYQYELPQSWVPNSPSFPGWKGRSMSGSAPPAPSPDSSRKIAYEVVESMLNKEGKNGRECILRAICEVAETPVNHNGIVGEVLQIFFSPGQHEKINQDYRDAKKAGLNRVSCEKMYPDCPMGHGLLDSFSLVKEFKFENWLNV